MSTWSYYLRIRNFWNVRLPLNLLYTTTIELAFENVYRADFTPVAGLFLVRLGFENIFKTQWVFKTRRSALLAITCSKYRNNFELTCQLTEKLFETSSVRWNLLGWQIWTVLFEKEPWKVKPPLKAPKKSRHFWKFLGFFGPNSVEPFLREYLNYSNITWKRSLILKTHCVLKEISKRRRVENSPATGTMGWLQ